MNKVKLLCEKNRSQCLLIPKEFNYLTYFTYRMQFLYGLPKIHNLNVSAVNTNSPDKFGYIQMDPPLDLKFCGCLR